MRIVLVRRPGVPGSKEEGAAGAEVEACKSLRLSPHFKSVDLGFIPTMYKALAGCIARKRAPAGKRLALRGGGVRVANAVPLTPGTHRPPQVRHQRPIDHVHNERLVCVIRAVVTARES